jgi:hypothetical protein
MDVNTRNAIDLKYDTIIKRIKEYDRRLRPLLIAYAALYDEYIKHRKSYDKYPNDFVLSKLVNSEQTAITGLQVFNRDFDSIPVLIDDFVPKIIFDKIKYKTNSKVLEYLQEKRNKYDDIMREFNDFYFNNIDKVKIIHKDVAKQRTSSYNTKNYQNHVKILRELSHEKDTECAGRFSIIDNIYSEIAEINFQDIVQDNIHLKNTACYFLELLKSNLSELVDVSDFYIEKESITPLLSQNSPLSDTSSEGLVWTVGYAGNPNAFATMKYAKPQASEDYNILHELLVGMVLNKLRNRIPYFMYVYVGFTCNPPTERGPKAVAGTSVKNDYDFNTLCTNNNSKNIEHIMFSEIVPNPISFLNYFKIMDLNVLLKKKFMRCLLQVLCSLQIAQTEFRYTHGDLHGNNILIRTLPSEVDITYTVSGNNYVIRTDVIVTIIDYGFSEITYNSVNYKPLSHNWNLGNTLFHSEVYLEDYVRSSLDLLQLYDFVRLIESFDIATNRTTLTELNTLMPDMNVVNYRQRVKSLYEANSKDPKIIADLNFKSLEDVIKVYYQSIQPRGIFH